MLLGLAILIGASATDFGERTVAPAAAVPMVASATAASVSPAFAAPMSLSGAASIASRFGRVTSLTRSPEHNRRVGGVVNSFHLSGRAIDIARRPGVSHAQIAAELRRAGFYLVEALDEGDHSHFAFSWGGATYRPLRPQAQTQTAASQGTQWKVVYAPGARRSR